jgi:hypothetical protein
MFPLCGVGDLEGRADHNFAETINGTGTCGLCHWLPPESPLKSNSILPAMVCKVVMKHPAREAKRSSSGVQRPLSLPNSLGAVK